MPARDVGFTRPRPTYPTRLKLIINEALLPIAVPAHRSSAVGETQSYHNDRFVVPQFREPAGYVADLIEQAPPTGRARAPAATVLRGSLLSATACRTAKVPKAGRVRC